MIRYIVDALTGRVTLRLSCALWLFNCAGLPLALQPYEEEVEIDVEPQVCIW